MKNFAISLVLSGLIGLMGGCGTTTATQPESSSAAPAVSANAAPTASANAAPRATQTWLEESIGGYKQVHLYVPATQSPVGKGRALLIVLHGCMQKPIAFTTANIDKAADEFGAVIALPDAMHKQGYDCWAFWQKPARTGANDYALLLNLVQTLLAQPDLQIDPAQVYISGISSGGIFAMQTGCLAPEVFAGMGVYGAPSAGTPAHATLRNTKTGSPETVAEFCLTQAGEHKDAFATQMTSAASGERDPLTNPTYAMQSAQGMALIYNVEQQPETRVIEEAKGADEIVWQNGRVSHLMIRTVGHDWPGGEEARGSFVTANGLNYARYLLRFFSAHTLRAK